MRWPVALSFRDFDLDLARKSARELSQAGVGAYYYEAHLAYETGSLLYEKHIQIYSTAVVVGMFLRADFLERPFTALEYCVVRQRSDLLQRTAMIVMEPGAEFLLPSGARHVLRLYDGDEVTRVTRSAALLLAAVRS